MLRRTALKTLAATTALVAAPAIAQSTTEIIVEYSIPDLFKTLHEDIARAFMKANPQYKITFRAPQPGYEEITQSVLRAAITNTLPDVAYHGLNRQRIFVDRGIAQPLEAFIAADAQFKEFGHARGLLDIGKIKGKQYGIGFSLSTPIIYVNGDLVAKAGGNLAALPATWDGIFELARKVKALGGSTQGFHFDWDITGNWMFQALVFSNGGTMLSEDEKRVAFDGEAGKQAITALSRMVKEGTMRDVAQSVALQDFTSGTMGIWGHSTSRLGGVTKQVGEKFKLRTAAFPTAANGRLPMGGNTAMLFAKDPAKQKAAWEYIKFATGPVGATMMVKATGYFPSALKVADDPAMLKDFYAANPNHLVAMKQLPKATGWYAFPGENGLKITDVIKDHLQSVVAQKAEPMAALATMSKEVQALLPA
ncbi:MAG: ABC transporter substrate-binding protein [Alphaproteobacteria bacterium]|nr:ABC transporter substrate-binding protein [Alphaproteobacteria bacterium]MCW5741454.1 ABC transporter substrate-binding protein [Alphaproteobacteria bacterium]